MICFMNAAEAFRFTTALAKNGGDAAAAAAAAFGCKDAMEAQKRGLQAANHPLVLSLMTDWSIAVDDVKDCWKQLRGALHATKFMKGYGEAPDWPVRLGAVKLYFKMFGLDRVPARQELVAGKIEETLDLSGWSKDDLLNAITEDKKVNGEAKAPN